MNKSFKDIIIVGFALFAMFFGAGNLIFPPSLGLSVGDAWLPGMIGFIITGIGLPLLGIIAASKAGGSVRDVGDKVSKGFSKVFAIAILLAIGPLFAIPRTAATTFEVGIKPFVGTSSTLMITICSIIFFLITVYFTINPTTVVDKVGKILTPFLLIALLVIIVKGIITPIGTPINTGVTGSFGKGFIEGYNTMDALASLVFAGIVIKYFVDKGYSDIKSQVSLTIKAGIVSSIGFIIVYGGLTYIGATTSGVYKAGMDQTALTINIARSLLGTTGQSVLSVAVALACLTTAVGLTATCGEYFSNLTKGKVSYKAMVIIVSVFSCVMSVVGVSTIVKISVPVLVLLYPVAAVLMVLTVFDKFIRNKNVYKGAVIGAFVVSLFDALTIAKLPIESVNTMISKIPLAGFGLGWIIPSIVGMLIGLLFKYNKKQA
ncbi:branched-chain amino acid transport system II carrier protein [Clostridium cylindrosporum]|uniref:Branched-chain amino acid transport system carrier protein n=1 Tax=Clostridium cylindrosporum DSM 605 TaxID=1121307 RepID=A0A0J8D5I9_CLOCY|nr:branched-chain amino acid transport system II carrier protein [Clostridium cylindrosporum]KMT21092.1 branched-chain amino acid transport system carrier protein BraB [Clostridium cylindrosporum DSM 605]